MKNKIVRGWTLQRILFLSMGGLIVAQSIAEKQWPGIFLGGYFAVMGIFALGCAGNGCGISGCSVEVPQPKKESGERGTMETGDPSFPKL